MKIPLNKTIRPTQLQPKLYSVINDLAKRKDYKCIINKDNEPMCVIVSYSLIKNIDLDQEKKDNNRNLINDMKEYYSNFSEDETALFNDAIDDGL